MLSLVCGMSVLMCSWIIFTDTHTTQFCTIDDEIYQEIQINLQKWVSNFFSSASLPAALRFEVQGKTYVVRADLTSDGTEIFYVATASGWPGTLEGLKGYLYTSSGQIPSNYWPPVYKTRHLAGNIYCYSEYEIK